MKRLPLLILNVLLLFSVPSIAGQNITGNLYVSGNVGVGSTAPGKALDVNGTVRAQGINLPNATNNYVLTSDANGNGTWQSATGGSGTNYWLQTK